jgi:hypothetical protein
MARFEATVRVFDLVESDAPTARRTVEERLRAAGFDRWQVVNLELQPATPPMIRPRRRPTNIDASYAGGVLLAVTVLAWAIWFLWVLVG